MQGTRRSWGLAAWQLVIAASALTGVVLAALQYDVWWTALSQLTSLAAGAGYLMLAAGSLVSRTGSRREAVSAWFRGATASTMLLVALAFLAMQHGNLLDPYSVFEHMLTPALVVADQVLVRHDRAGVRRWHPWTWLLPPAAYLAWYVAGDLRVYMHLDPSRPSTFTAHAAVLLVLLLASAFAMHAAAQPAGQSSG